MIEDLKSRTIAGRTIELLHNFEEFDRESKRLNKELEERNKRFNERIAEINTRTESIREQMKHDGFDELLLKLNIGL